MLNYSLLTEAELIEITQKATSKMTYREEKTQKQIILLIDLKNQQKREKAFRELLKKYYGLIKNLVNLYSQSNQTRHQKDLKQEAIIAFYEAITKFDKSRKVKLSTWVFYRIKTKLKSISQQIKKQEKTINKVRINQEFLSSLKEESSRKTQLKQVLVLLCQLTKKQQKVVNLQLKGYSWEIIAKTLNSTPDAVRMVWNRAVKRLRKLLNNQSKQ